MRTRTRALVLGTAAAATVLPLLPSAPVAAAPPPAPATAGATAVLPYQDASLPVAKRVADLLGRMTLEEKVGQMTQAERAAVAADPSPITTLGSARCCPAAARRRRRTPPTAWADMVDGFQRAGAGHPAAASR